VRDPDLDVACFLVGDVWVELATCGVASQRHGLPGFSTGDNEVIKPQRMSRMSIWTLGNDEERGGSFLLDDLAEHALATLLHNGQRLHWVESG
jgi:hypothetical protein